MLADIKRCKLILVVFAQTAKDQAPRTLPSPAQPNPTHEPPETEEETAETCFVPESSWSVTAFCRPPLAADADSPPNILSLSNTLTLSAGARHKSPTSFLTALLLDHYYTYAIVIMHAL